jgi:hypothetical protein
MPPLNIKPVTVNQNLKSKIFDRILEKAAARGLFRHEIIKLPDAVKTVPVI